MDTSSGTGPITIPQFCKRHQISRSHYYTLKAAGLGPTEMDLLGVKRISPKADAEWVERMEGGPAAKVEATKPGKPARKTTTVPA